MAGQRIGYVRVSSSDQNSARQLDGVHVDRMFTDKVSGKDTDRPQLTLVMAYARAGDTVLVHSMDRLARNLDDLRRLVQQLTERGVKVEFLKEGLTFTGEDSAMSKLLLSVMGAFAEFERSLIRERQREGIVKAKAAGVYKGRRPSLTSDQLELLREMAAARVPKGKLAKTFGVSRSTVYYYLKQASPDPSRAGTETVIGDGWPAGVRTRTISPSGLHVTKIIFEDTSSFSQ